MVIAIMYGFSLVASPLAKSDAALPLQIDTLSTEKSVIADTVVLILLPQKIMMLITIVNINKQLKTFLPNFINKLLQQICQKLYPFTLYNNAKP